MNNEKVRLECSPKLVKGHSKVNRAHPPLGTGYLVKKSLLTKDYCIVSTNLANLFIFWLKEYDTFPAPV